MTSTNTVNPSFQVNVSDGAQADTDGQGQVTINADNTFLKRFYDILLHPLFLATVAAMYGLTALTMWVVSILYFVKLDSPLIIDKTCTDVVATGNIFRFGFSYGLGFALFVIAGFVLTIMSLKNDSRAESLLTAVGAAFGVYVFSMLIASGFVIYFLAKGYFHCAPLLLGLEAAVFFPMWFLAIGGCIFICSNVL